MTDSRWTRRRFLKAVGVGAAALSLPSIEVFGRDANKPNVLFIFTDDQCFEKKRTTPSTSTKRAVSEREE